MQKSVAGTPGGVCRVWIVNHYADAPDRPAGTRHFDLARQLVRRGQGVTIFASGFSHGTGEDVRLKRWQLFRSESLNGVRFVWLKTFAYRGNTWRRRVNMLSYLVTFLVVQTRFSSPDVVIGVTVQPFAALGAWVVARRRHARFIFEIGDLWPQTLVDLGAMRVGSPGEILLRAIEAFLVRHASVVVSLLPGVHQYLRKRGLPTDRYVYLPNGVDLEAFDGATGLVGGEPDAAGSPLAAVRRLQVEGRLVLGYVGAFGLVNRVDVIVRAAAIAEARAPGRIGLVLVGDGPERANVERLVSAGGAIVLAPAVPKSAVPVILRALDALVVHATATPVYQYGISFNKLFEYMAAARPVVFACLSAYDPVAGEGAGISVAPDDPSLLADAFLAMADAGADERARMGTAGRDYVEREHSVERLGGLLAEIVSADTPAGSAAFGGYGDTGR
jgi:glycosyltransferase involved in cell wall biosynthesis